MVFNSRVVPVFMLQMTILLTKIAAARNEVALSNYRVRRLYFLAVVFAVTITFPARLYALQLIFHHFILYFRSENVAGKS